MSPNDQVPFPIIPPEPAFSRTDRPLRVGVIGAGIAGLGAAWALAEKHSVTLFERDSRPGGHSHTIDLDLPEGRLPVDTGFIVFNDRTYPNLTALFDHLDVATRPTEVVRDLPEGQSRLLQGAVGVEWVFVAGTPVVAAGTPTGRSKSGSGFSCALASAC